MDHFSFNKQEDRKPLQVLLPAEAQTKLEELRQASKKETLSQLVEEAIEWYMRIRMAPEPALVRRLTPRLRDVLRLVGQGHTTKEIAALLGISVKTVEMHRTQLMKTLKIRGLADLVRFAIRAGLVELRGG
jgi:DNA-binding NarL/FixJ family response regulator